MDITQFYHRIWPKEPPIHSFFWRPGYAAVKERAAQAQFPPPKWMFVRFLFKMEMLYSISPTRISVSNIFESASHGIIVVFLDGFSFENPWVWYIFGSPKSPKIPQKSLKTSPIFPQTSHGGAWRPWATVPSPRARSGRAPRRVRVRHGRRRGRRIRRGCRWSFPWVGTGWETEKWMDNWWTIDGLLDVLYSWGLIVWDSLRYSFYEFFAMNFGFVLSCRNFPETGEQHFQVADAQRLIESVCGKKQLDQSMGLPKMEWFPMDLPWFTIWLWLTHGKSTHFFKNGR